MRDLDEQEVRDRLAELAGGIDLRRSLERPTLRRVRRRRATTVLTSALVVLGLVGASLAGYRSLTRGGPTIGGDPSPSPAPSPGVDEPAFPAVWPETDPAALAEIQRAVDDGHHPLRADAAGTATLFAVNLLGWPPGSVIVVGTTLEGDTTAVELRNDRFDEGRSPVVVHLRQLGATGPGGVWSVVLPPDVATAAERVRTAALARDLDTLATLLDPNTFAYNFDDGSDPIPAWRRDPSDLDLVARVLELVPVGIEIEGMGRFYVWPYLMHADLQDPTPEQRRDLERLGIGPDELTEMLRAFGGYVGPRLSIDETGLWRNFAAGGD